MNKITDIDSNETLIDKMGQQTEGSTENVFSGHTLENYISGLSYDKEIMKINHLKEFLENRELFYSNWDEENGKNDSSGAGNQVFIE